MAKSAKARIKPLKDQELDARRYRILCAALFGPPEIGIELDVSTRPTSKADLDARVDAVWRNYPSAGETT